ncbi:Short chain dehydrogenase yanD [Lasiodiplodia theobromae]|uniref:Short chain dehydrogenase yanD n=1 Tax=Lasiodiplodia theobromae TaxID=45133 RepID=A0A5N5D221_9PEZI|nr:Short chain dehydrogenase yanD [Lasiodiplodia theobromae]
MPPNTIYGISLVCEASYIQFRHRQLCATPPAISPSSIKLRDETAVITGTNAALALKCSRPDHHGRPHWRTYNIDVWKLNMFSYVSITAPAERCCKTLPVLDVTVLNAGVAKSPVHLDPAPGHDEVIRVNCLSTALLKLLILQVVHAKAQAADAGRPGRIVLVKSETAAWAKSKERSE